jgi:CheY-like chemotaxis protein
MSSETILLVDDCPDDVLLIRLALARAGITQKLIVVSDGEKALLYLRGENPFADRAAFPLPKVVLLDLAMPRMGGFEVLEWIRRQPHLSQTPVIVLTGSALIADSRRAYELGANSFVTKPADLTELTLALKEIVQSWLGRATPPVAEIGSNPDRRLPPG